MLFFYVMSFPLFCAKRQYNICLSGLQACPANPFEAIVITFFDHYFSLLSLVNHILASFLSRSDSNMYPERGVMPHHYLPFANGRK